MLEKYQPFEQDQITDLQGDDGVTYELYLPKKFNERLVFENEYCAFKPVGFVRTDFGWMPLTYKVVTKDFGSLALRKNPTPMFFPPGEWVFEKNELEYGNKDYGGIWTAYRLGNANTIKAYCLKEKSMETRTFLTGVYNPVAFVGGYRVKSEGVMLIKEI